MIRNISVWPPLPLPSAFAATHAGSVSLPVVRYAVRNPMRRVATTAAPAASSPAAAAATKRALTLYMGRSPIPRGHQSFTPKASRSTDTAFVPPSAAVIETATLFDAPHSPLTVSVPAAAGAARCTVTLTSKRCVPSSRSTCVGTAPL